jgi:hypothetical protein
MTEELPDIGSVNKFAERQGLDPRDPTTLGRYTAALIAGTDPLAGLTVLRPQRHEGTDGIHYVLPTETPEAADSPTL